LAAIEFGWIHQRWAQIIGRPSDSILPLAWGRMIGMQMVRRIEIGRWTEVDEHPETLVHQVALKFREGPGWSRWLGSGSHSG
jgi:hypothetical protein